MKHARLHSLFLLLVLCVSATAQDTPLTAQALVERQQVFAGEPFVFQIRVDGSESPDKPKLSSLTDFDVQELGGQQNSSQSVTIVNGRMNRVVRKGYVFNYRLTAKTTGQLVIPAVMITADGRSVQTNAIRIAVSEPQETDDFKLRIFLSDSKVYVGQPVIMTVKWYIAKNVREFAFQVPVLTDSRFDISDPKLRIDPNKHLQVPVSGQETIAEKAQEVLDGKQYLTVSFRKILFPKKAGTIPFPQSTVAGRRSKATSAAAALSTISSTTTSSVARPSAGALCTTASSCRRTRRSCRYSTCRRRGVRTVFTGLVGEYKISAEASPTDVNVGDPITVTVRLSGPPYLDNAEIPPLSRQPSLAQDFKIPPEQADGQVEGDVKKFTQTLRARHSDVSQIPPIELSYFSRRRLPTRLRGPSRFRCRWRARAL